MVRERIADDVYVFTSRRYAQVTAGAILTKDGVILIDTLYYPEETKAVKQFLEERLGHKVRYVVYTHYHADHTQGGYLFPEARIVSHARCRYLLDTIGREGLAEAKSQTSELDEVKIVLPDLIFEEGELFLYLGDKTIRLHHLPGHSPDLIGVLVTEDSIFFPSDNAMPVPTFFDGSYDDLVHSLERILLMEPDFMVRGHGEVVLRGELESVIHNDLKYLQTIRQAVSEVVENGEDVAALAEIGIESCGKSRILLNGLVTDLHRANLRKLYQQLSQNSGS